MTEAPLLQLNDVTITFDYAAGALHAVEDLTFHVNRGEVLGLVGESGSGKTLTGFSIMGALDDPGVVSAGEILFKGEDLTKMPPSRLRALRGSRLAMIMQDPMMTLNPTLTIGTQITEAILAHRKTTREHARQLATEALEMVGIGQAQSRLSSYPHEYSGGMRQRVAIAIALLHEPDLIVADEPTTALDVTVQAQILIEVRRLVRSKGAALIWITHDLSVIAGLADRVAVMYAGRIVEQGPTREVLTNPRHPYTYGLLKSSPENEPLENGKLWQIAGSAPSIAQRPEGCVFRPRCAHASETCLSLPGESAGAHSYACWHPRSNGSADG